MSVLRYSFFSLPVHHYTYSKYYQRHDEHVRKCKLEFNRTSPIPFSELSRESQASTEDFWWWPPWKFNDIVGYVEIGADTGYEIAATIFLMQKYFPRDRTHTRGTREIIYFSEVSSAPIRGRDNEAYLRALDEIISRANRILKGRNKHFVLYLPPFEWSCLDLVRIHQQARMLDRSE